ncbi:hypothetical protein FHQ18_03035 [Deferribacter autotrophicus]|uniref:Peptidase C45 hydrolase domain-containing protein n=1 Tax=Deferribacter autotrophicus TaxID=500465 RepID=A0A5A8F4P8_9BACT|nr:carcinine hydrolase/isopenicillin-N N-acyltransferase family protein [Deferribacter autotrophicus]KAA0258937.1 hypothetical protein FHQ18_03035 [Deferribacter autotrophicus]
MNLWHVKNENDLAATQNKETFLFFQNLLHNSLKLTANNSVAYLINNFVKILVYKIKKNLSQEYLNFLKIYATANNISLNNLLLAVSFPDIFSYMLSKTGSKMYLNIPHVFLGCSTLLLPTENGVLHCRNLDYFGGKLWTSNHAVMLLNFPNMIKSINITTMGLPVVGITSLNEAGISLSVHMLFTKEVNINGSLVTDLAFQVITKATNISDVLKIVKDKPTVSGWAFIVFSHKENKGVLIEFNGKKTCIKELNSLPFIYNNFYMTREQQSSELYPSYIWIQNNFYRNNHLKRLLSDKQTFSLKDAIKIISDTSDYHHGNKDPFGHTVANSFTVTSAIFDVNNERLSLGENHSPAGVGINKIYDLSKIFNGELDEIDKINIIQDEKKRAFYNAVVSVMDILYTNQDYEKCINILDKLGENLNDSYFTLLLYAILLIKKEDFIRAKEKLYKALEKTYLDSYRLGMIKLLVAAIEDFTGKKKIATELYADILQNHRFVDLNILTLKLYTKGVDKNFFKKVVPNFFLSHFLII